MKVALLQVGKGRRDRALPVMSVAFASGEATLATAETEQRPTVLGLIASGRMRPDTGQVTIDGRADASALRRRIALVDAPGVSEPESNVTLGGVVAEELMFAARRSDPLAVGRWLDEHGLGRWRGVPIADVDPADRVRALCELAVLRAGVEGLVLVAPDRHGGEPDVWWRIAREFADRGYAVLVIAGIASRAALDAQRAEASRIETASAVRRRPRPSAVRLRRAGGATRSAGAVSAAEARS